MSDLGDEAPPAEITLQHYRLLMAHDMAEATLVDRIVELAGDMGWRAYHQRPARTARGYRTALQGHKGFPDLVLASGQQTIFVECKSHTGQLDADQRRWRDVLTAGGADWRLWRPMDWLNGDIQNVIVRV